MRSLSYRQAATCEQASTTRCTCRCGGAFHGSRRVIDVDQLPEDDPHRPHLVRKRRRGNTVAEAAEQLIAAWAEQDELQWAAAVRSARIVEDTLPL